MTRQMTEEEMIREARNAYHQEYREKNRKRINENQKKWREKNAEKISESTRNYWLRKFKEQVAK